MARYSKNEKAEALARLREWIKPGDTVYTILDRVSSSGMSRVIRVVLLKVEDGKVIDLHPNHAVARVLGLRHATRHGRTEDGLVISGCGMDMGFHLVYSLSRVLFAEGFQCVGKNCPSNDHTNGDRNRAPHQHSDPGYALNHRWL